MNGMRWRSWLGAVALGLVALVAKPALGDTVPAGANQAAPPTQPAEATLPAGAAKALEEARRLHNAAQKLIEQGRTEAALELG